MADDEIIIIGIDPGLLHTGWGVIGSSGNRLRFLGAGAISPKPGAAMATRLLYIQEELAKILAQYQPHEAAIEETFMHKNAASALKLGMARGVAIASLAAGQLAVSEYPANVVKKSVVGYGHAEKEQVQAMIARLIPGIQIREADVADAIAIAITHAHHRAVAARWAGIGNEGRPA